MRTWLLTAVACALAVWLFWPGFLSPDSLAQLEQARAGVFDDWHPPLMAALWRPLDRAWPGPQAMLLLQNLVFWTACALLARELFEPRWRPLCALVPLLLPPVLALLGTIWKDVLLGATLLLAVAVLLRQERRPPRAAGWALAPLLLGLACALRYNAFAAVAPLCVSWALQLSRAHPARVRRPLLAGALAALLVPAGGLGLSRALTDHRSFAEQAIWLHDLAALSLETGEVLYPDYLVARTPPATLEALANDFDPLAADRLLYGRLRPLTGDPRARGQLLRAWLRALARHPLYYTKHRLRLGAALVTHGPRTRTTPFQWGVDPNALGVTFIDTPLRARVHGLFEELAGTPLFAAWPWLLVLAFGLRRGLRRGEAGEALAAVCGSGLLYEAANVLLAPVTDFRYSWWPVLAGLVSLGLLWRVQAPQGQVVRGP